MNPNRYITYLLPHFLGIRVTHKNNKGQTMFKNYTKKYAQMMGLTEEEYADFLKRYMYYLLGRKITKQTIDNGFFIVEEIIEKREKLKKNNLKYATKHPLILRYRDEIIELYQEEKYGEKAISNIMKANHKATISAHQIRYFLKKNNLLRQTKKKEQEIEEAIKLLTLN